MIALTAQMGDIWFFSTPEGVATFSILFIVAIIIIILIVRKKRQSRKGQKVGASPAKMPLTPAYEKSLLRKFQKVIDISTRIRKAEVAQFLGVSEAQLLDLLVEWGKILPFKVDGDYLVIEDVSAFTQALDKQFSEWGAKEQSKDDKI